MGIEIERKFLVANDAWRAASIEAIPLRQGYLAIQGTTLRVRIAGRVAWLTLKGAARGLRRLEFEYPIPLDDAETLLRELAILPVIDKVRHRVPHEGHLWEIDVFAGANAGLILAEIELTDEAESFARPPWLGAEVSPDPRYLNFQLASHPFSTWTASVPA